LGDGEKEKHRQSHQPKPWRERGDNAPAVQKPNRHEIKQIEKKPRVGQTLKHQVASGKVKDFAEQCSYRSQNRPANPDHRFNPRVARRLLQQDDRAHKRNKHRRAHFQAEPFGRDQMAAFVNEQQQNKSNREPNAPKNGVNPNG